MQRNEALQAEHDMARGGDALYFQLHNVLEIIRLREPGLSEFFDNHKKRRDEQIELLRTELIESEERLEREQRAHRFESEKAKNRILALETLKADVQFWKGQARGKEDQATTAFNELKWDLEAQQQKVAELTRDKSNLVAEQADLNEAHRALQQEHNNLELEKTTQQGKAEIALSFAEETIDGLKREQEVLKLNEAAVLAAAQEALSMDGRFSEGTIGFLRQTRSECDEQARMIGALETEVLRLRGREQELTQYQRIVDCRAMFYEGNEGKAEREVARLLETLIWEVRVWRREQSDSF